MRFDVTPAPTTVRAGEALLAIWLTLLDADVEERLHERMLQHGPATQSPRAFFVTQRRDLDVSRWHNTRVRRCPGVFRHEADAQHHVFSLALDTDPDGDEEGHAPGGRQELFVDETVQLDHYLDRAEECVGLLEGASALGLKQDFEDMLVGLILNFVETGQDAAATAQEAAAEQPVVCKAHGLVVMADHIPLPNEPAFDLQLERLVRLLERVQAPSKGLVLPPLAATTNLSLWKHVHIRLAVLGFYDLLVPQQEWQSFYAAPEFEEQRVLAALDEQVYVCEGLAYTPQSGIRVLTVTGCTPFENYYPDSHPDVVHAIEALRDAMVVTRNDFGCRELPPPVTLRMLRALIHEVSAKSELACVNAYNIREVAESDGYKKSWFALHRKIPSANSYSGRWRRALARP